MYPVMAPWGCGCMMEPSAGGASVVKGKMFQVGAYAARGDGKINIKGEEW